MCRWNDAICISQPGVGVHLFPVAVAEQDHGLTKVRLLPCQDGLIGRQILAITSIGSDLFIADRQSIVCWDGKTDTTRLLLNTSDKLGQASLGMTVDIAGLTSDYKGRALYAIFTHRAEKYPATIPIRYAIYKLSLADLKWTKTDEYDKKTFPSLLPNVPDPIHEAVEYDGGIIAILGTGPNQRVSYFPGISFKSALLPPDQGSTGAK